MDMARLGPPAGESLSSSSRRKYDVFLTFIGEQGTAKVFTNKLYATLIQAGLNTFFKEEVADDVETRVITEVERAIKESRASIIVFSAHFASACNSSTSKSKWCSVVEELAKILEYSGTTFEDSVLPVYYGVDPSQVDASIREALYKYEEEEFKAEEEITEDKLTKAITWREALKKTMELDSCVVLLNPHDIQYREFERQKKMANLFNGIREVWDHNLDKEILLMEFVMRRYTMISFDTEYLGFLRKTPRDASKLKIYDDLKFNVDRLNPIQFGFTLFDRTGNVGGTWQINFSDFDTEINTNDWDASTSLSLIKRKSGIDFQKQRQEGVMLRSFAHKFGEALKHHANLEWVTFHGLYDFGYLTKVITGYKPLPASSTKFRLLLGDIFGYNIYDAKFIAMFCPGLCGGELSLKKLATILQVERIGNFHQAGYDSLVTAQVFLKMKETYSFDVKMHGRYLYALGRIERRNHQLQQVFPPFSQRPIIFSSDNDDDRGDDDDEANNDGGGGLGSGAIRGTSSGRRGGAYNLDTDSQHDGGMSWHGNDNYYATQGTYHIYRPEINEQRRHLADLTRFPSYDEYFSGYDPHSQSYRRIDDQLQSLNLGQHHYGSHSSHPYPTSANSHPSLFSHSSSPQSWNNDDNSISLFEA